MAAYFVVEIDVNDAAASAPAAEAT